MHDALDNRKPHDALTPLQLVANCLAYHLEPDEDAEAPVQSRDRASRVRLQWSGSDKPSRWLLRRSPMT